MIPALLLPILTSLASNGLNLLAGAVTAKGKEYVESELGVKIDSLTQSEEGLFKLKQLETEHEEFLINAAQKAAELTLEEQRLDLDNTKSARDMNTRIQESDSASTLSKHAAYYLDFGIVSATILLACLLLFAEIPEGNRDIAFSVMGSLVTMCGTILMFHRGSTARSANKDSTISALSKRNNDEAR